MLLLNPRPTRFVTPFLQMMRNLRLKYALRGSVNLQEFIALKLGKEEGTVVMIKDNQSFHQRHIFIKRTKPLLILMRMADSNQPHTDKLRSIVPMVDDHIRMSMPDLNDEDYLPPAIELEYEKYEEGTDDDDPSEYLSDDEYVSDTEDGIPY